MCFGRSRWAEQTEGRARTGAGDREERGTLMSMQRFVRLFAAALAVVVLAALVGCSSGTPSGNTTVAPSTGSSGGSATATGSGTASGSAAATPGEIVLKDFSFQPANMEVKVGTKVTWRNEDTAQHTVTSDDGAFTSPALDSGATYSFTFASAGTFKYHCSIHPSMVGQVVVK
jgi:plastocyanin